MEIACAFFGCHDPAQQFLLLCTHKHPLCDLHFSLTVASNHSRVSVLPISQWSEVQSKAHLPSPTLGVFLELQKAADTMLRVAEEQLDRVCEAIDKRMKTQIIHTNRLARAMLFQLRIDRSALITEKCKEQRFLAKERRFHRALVEYLRQEVRSTVQDLKAELHHHEGSPSAELTPVARAFAACGDFLQYFVPCLGVDCRGQGTQPWPEVDIKGLKRVEVRELLESALNFSFCAAPVFAEVQRMRRSLHSKGNDLNIEDVELFPEVCKGLREQVQTAQSPAFYSTELRFPVKADVWLICQACRIHAKVQALPVRCIQNNPTDFAELSEFASSHNEKGGACFESEQYSEALDYFHAARYVGKQILGYELALSLILSNISYTLERLHLYSEAIKYYSKHAKIARSLADTDQCSLAARFSNLLVLCNNISEAEQSAKQAVDLAITAVPYNASSHLSMLCNLGYVLALQAEYTRAEGMYKEALDMCFTTGASDKKYGEVCMNLARVELSLQHFDESAALLEQAQAAVGNDNLVLKTQVILHMIHYRIPQARTVLFALVRTTQDPWPAMMLARIARELEHVEEGLQWVSRGMKCSFGTDKSTKVDLYIECGLLYCAKKDWAKGRQWLEAAAALPTIGKQYGALQRALATVALAEDQLDHCEQLLKAALAADEQVKKKHRFVEADLQKLGELRLRQQRLDESEQYLRKAIEDHSPLRPSHPELAESYYWLANVLFAKQDFDEALSSVSRSLEIDQAKRPGHSSVARSLQLLGRILRAKGDRDAAVQCMQQALSIFQGKAYMESEASETLQLLSQLD